jgi:hypothetical protein
VAPIFVVGCGVGALLRVGGRYCGEELPLVFSLFRGGEGGGESMRGITGEFVDKARLELAFVEVCKVAGEVQ